MYVAILLLPQLLLLAAAVRDRVPDGKICSRGSLHLIPVFSFSSFEHLFLPCTPWKYCRIFSVDSFRYFTYRTSSVLRACAKLRRALDRPGGAPVENIRIDMLAMSFEQSGNQI